MIMKKLQEKVIEMQLNNLEREFLERKTLKIYFWKNETEWIN